VVLLTVSVGKPITVGNDIILKIISKRSNAILCSISISRWTHQSWVALGSKEYITDNIYIRPLSTEKNEVRMGIKAPAEKNIRRQHSRKKDRKNRR